MIKLRRWLGWGHLLENFSTPNMRQSPVFRPPRCQDDRQRDIFPLPMLQKELSRSVKQRILRRDAVQRRVNMAVAALNSMYFGRNEAPDVHYCHRLSDLPLCQSDTLVSLLRRIKSWEPRPASACYQEALKALRVAGTSYAADPGVGDTVCMKLDKLSLPRLSGTGVSLDVELGGKEGEMLRDFEDHLLQDPINWASSCEEAARCNVYNDPGLRKPSFYRDFLQRLHQCGVLTFTRRPSGRVGAFAVTKKPKCVEGVMQERQRLILDCRQVNYQFRAPPLTELGSLSALCEVQLEQDEKLYVGGADIQDCFYACRLPKGLESFFCFLNDLRLGEVRRLWPELVQDTYDHVDGDEMISPCLGVLPMGFSWSFFLVQRLHEQLTIKSMGIEREELILDSRPVKEILPGKCAAMPYCDNVHVIGKDVHVAERMRVQVCEELRSRGFQVHEEAPASHIMPTLGGVIDGEQGIVRPTASRMWNVLLGFEYCLRHPVSSDFVRRLLGHAMVLCVLARPGMSIFRALYDFSSRGLPKVVLWRSAKRECSKFVAIAPLLFGSLRREWSTRVTCTDASPDGYGIVERELPLSSRF